MDLFDAMQEHICRTLAHFIVYLASHLNLQLSRKAEQKLLTASPTSWRILTRTPNEWHKRELKALSEGAESKEPGNSMDPFASHDHGLATQSFWNEPELTQPSLPPVIDYSMIGYCEKFPKSFCIPYSIQQESPLYFDGMQAVENPDLASGTLLDPSTSTSTLEMSVAPPSSDELWSTIMAPNPEYAELSQETDYSAVEFEDDLQSCERTSPVCPEWPNFFADSPNFTVPHPPPISINSKRKLHFKR